MSAGKLQWKEQKCLNFVQMMYFHRVVCYGACDEKLEGLREFLQAIGFQEYKKIKYNKTQKRMREENDFLFSYYFLRFIYA